MTSGSGDVLARGANRATYAMPSVSQAKWDAIFADDALPTPISSPEQHKAYVAKLLKLQRNKHRAQGDTDLAWQLVDAIKDYEDAHFSLEDTDG